MFREMVRKKQQLPREEALELIRKLSRKYTSDEAYIQMEIDHFGHELLVFALEPECVTGKITKES